VVVRGKELKSRKDGGQYLRLEFGDRSGRMFGNIWDDAEALFKDFGEGDVVKIQAGVEQFRDSRALTVRRIRKVRPSDEVDYADLTPAVSGDIDMMFARLLKMVGLVRNDNLRALLDSFFNDEGFSSAFKRAPAGKLWHHNRLGGLLEHTLTTVRLCRWLARLYPEADRDLLLTGALLHDIGKIEEYNYDVLIDYSDRGRLVGHIVLGAQWIARNTAEIEGFPAALLDAVQHLVLSHQGGPEQGSPTAPKTREAFLLHFADEIDSKMDAFNRLEAERLPGERWKFVNLLGRHLDLGAVEADNEQASV